MHSQLSLVVTSNQRCSCAQVNDEEVDELEDRLRSINSLAQVVRAQRADVQADYVLGIGGFDLNRVADEVILAEACMAAERGGKSETPVYSLLHQGAP